MGRLWARRKSLSLRELSRAKKLILLGFFYCNAPNCRSHAAGAARQKNVRAGYLLSRRSICLYWDTIRILIRAAPDDGYPNPKDHIRAAPDDHHPDPLISSQSRPR